MKSIEIQIMYWGIEELQSFIIFFLHAVDKKKAQYY